MQLYVGYLMKKLIIDNQEVVVIETYGEIKQLTNEELLQAWKYYAPLALNGSRNMDTIVRLLSKEKHIRGL